MKDWGVKKFTELKDSLFKIFLDIEKKIKGVFDSITNIPSNVKSGIGSFVKDITGIDLGLNDNKGNLGSMFDISKLKEKYTKQASKKVEQTNNNKIIINVTNQNGEQGASETSKAITNALKTQADSSRLAIGGI